MPQKQGRTIMPEVEERKHSTTDDTLQFTTDEALLGNGSFKGSIPSGSTDPADKIEYAFKVDACDGTKTSCPKQFYLNVYTRSDASVTDFYECRYDYLPSTGGAEGGDWTTVRFDFPTIADTAFSRPGTAGCPSGDKTLLQNAADNNYVLGTNDQFPMPPGGAGLIFSS